MFLSDEPGFYKPGDFGIRIENDMEVVLANRSSYDSTQFLRFDTITIVPYERSLIEVSLLTDAHIEAINRYHQKVLGILEPLLSDNEPALNALRSRTEYLDPGSLSTTTEDPGSKAFIVISSPILITLILVLIMLL